MHLAGEEKRRREREERRKKTWSQIGHRKLIKLRMKRRQRHEKTFLVSFFFSATKERNYISIFQIISCVQQALRCSRLSLRMNENELKDLRGNWFASCRCSLQFHSFHISLQRANQKEKISKKIADENNGGEKTARTSPTCID